MFAQTKKKKKMGGEGTGEERGEKRGQEGRGGEGRKSS